MQGLTQPTLLLKPFADSGDKNSIPVTNSDVSNPQLADLTNGFPEITGKKPEDGGLPPERKDFNGLGYLTTTYDYFYQAGGTFTFNATVSSAIGGYPQGARLWYTDGNGATTVLRSTKDNNTDNFVTTPSYIGTSWVQEIPVLGWDNEWTGSNTFSGTIISSSTNTFSGSNIFSGSISLTGTIIGGNTVRETIDGWGMPDYSAAVSKTKDVPYTADSNGYLIGYDHYFGTGGGNNAYIYINGVNVRMNPTQDNYSVNTWCYPISKGSSFSYSGSSDMNMYFVPTIGG